MRGRFTGVCRIVVLAVGLSWATLSPAASAAYFWHPEIAPRGPRVIVVSLKEQRIFVYSNGTLIGAAPVSSGKPGYDTPPGVYRVLQKEREHYSNRYDNAPMPFMQRLTWDGVALHSGEVPDHPASHGCIRLPPAFAQRLFAATRAGDVVVVAGDGAAPVDQLYPAVVAPINLAGQPMLLDGQDASSLAVLDTSPLNIVVSTHDLRVYVLQNGVLLASSSITMDANYTFAGTVLYVLDPPRTNAIRGVHHWSAYRLAGNGAVPDASDVAQHIRAPEVFGAPLRQALQPGAAVLVTDKPGRHRDIAGEGEQDNDVPP